MHFYEHNGASFGPEFFIYFTRNTLSCDTLSFPFISSYTPSPNKITNRSLILAFTSILRILHRHSLHPTISSFGPVVSPSLSSSFSATTDPSHFPISIILPFDY